MTKKPAWFAYLWVEWKWTVPNFLTLIRLGAGPVILCWYLYFYDTIPAAYAFGYGLAAIVLYALACLTDLADGAIAKSFPSQASEWGRRWDPLADKALVGFVIVTILCGGQVAVGWWSFEFYCIAAIVLREVAIVVWRSFADEKIEVKEWGRRKAAVQMVAFGFLLERGGAVFAEWGHASSWLSEEALEMTGTVILIAATTLTLVSFYEYARQTASGRQALKKMGLAGVMQDA